MYLVYIIHNFHFAIYGQHPDSLWSLHGLHECLVRRGEKIEAALIKQRLDLAAARAEIPIKASCFCRRAAAE